MPLDDVDARLAAQYRAARERMTALVEDADDARGSRVPACPAWTAADLVAHVTGLAADLGAGRRPGPDVQVWVDQLVDDRRERTATDIAAEWTQVAPPFEAMVEDKPHRWWGLVYDVLVHEHDLRGALDRPGERDGEAVDVALALGLRLVEGDLDKHGLPAFRLVADDGVHVVGEGEIGLTLEASRFEAVRLLGSRRTIDQVRAADFTGDLDRYLPGLVHMALPAEDLGEREPSS
jgi:uncharacterized protein (TIGR03083 family)